jgi:two-component system KDP operon response regulator KdpE
VIRQRQTVLVVDDDPRIRSLVAAELQAAGYRVVGAADGTAGFLAFLKHRPALVVTDLAMPGRDGFDLVREIRERDATPILVLSVRAADGDKIRALDLGADDYVVKPFSVPELLARVRAQLRRSPQRPAGTLRFPDLIIDLDRRRVVQGQRELHLTPTELGLLELLATHAGRPVTLVHIIRAVWRSAPATTPDTVRVHVRSLRKKLEPDPANPRYIVTEPWVGYRFLAEPLSGSGDDDL